MKFFVLFSALLAVVLCQGGNSTTSTSTTSTASPPAEPEPAIIQGEPVAVGEIPYQAALFLRNGNFQCGGSLIRENMVLTAAHCVPNDRFLYVGFGGNHWNNQPYMEVADYIIVHENYDAQRISNDLAVLRLPRPAVGPTIGLITLANQDIGDLVYVPVRGSGYGNVQNTGPLSPDLMKVNLLTISNEECRNSNQVFWDTLMPGNICARYSTDYRQAVCHGDSGGPLVMRANNGQEIQVGVVSYGLGNACNHGPQAFARVSYFRDWIENAVARLNAA